MLENFGFLTLRTQLYHASWKLRCHYNVFFLFYEILSLCAELQFIKCHGWVIWPVVWARNSYPMILKAKRLIHNRCCFGGNHSRQCFSINEMLLWAIEPISFNQWTFITTFTEKLCAVFINHSAIFEKQFLLFLKPFYGFSSFAHFKVVQWIYTLPSWWKKQLKKPGSKHEIKPEVQ